MGKLDERVKDEVAKGRQSYCVWGRVGDRKGTSGRPSQGPPFPLLLYIKGVFTHKYLLIAI